MFSGKDGFSERELARQEKGPFEAGRPEGPPTPARENPYLPLFCWAVLAVCFGAAFSGFACVAFAFTGAEFVGAFADALEFCAGFCVCAALAGAVAVVLAVCVAALGRSAFVFTGALAVAVVLPSALAGTAFFPAAEGAALCGAALGVLDVGFAGWLF